MLTIIHASHLGAETCLCKARDIIYWTKMNSEVKDFISNCTACNDYLQNNSKEPVINHPIPSKPWSISKYNDHFQKKLFHCGRLLLQLPGIRHTEKQSKNCKCDSILQK